MQIHTPPHALMCVLSSKMNNNRAEATATVYMNRFAWISNLGNSVTPIFLLIDHFLYNFLHLAKKMKKIYHLEAPVHLILLI